MTMNPTHRDESASTDQDAAYDRLVARYSAPDTLTAALEQVTAEARRRAEAREEAAEGRPPVGIVEEDTARRAALRPAHRSSSQVPSSGNRREAIEPYAARSSATATEAAIGAPPRPYAVTGGRTRPRYQLAIEALVVTTADTQRLIGMLPEHQRICYLCRDIKSVAEISALLSIPLGVARILVADLAEGGFVAIHQPGGSDSHGSPPDTSLLERVLGGLRKL
ncbi:DUF742 domain-containing protein [Streptomyces albogriseolus]|uniref:DUF742 domain-containing protein n=1 Tax=Streptomyces albogriseolus TaxID=1887 RepID=UPI002252CB95|nr:DUF742 domain-containing protein [Streptomyces viridodiastaticus]MCX4618031.1 DUF742 domain-containing protein [Streptomyces viridodiastaticus]